MARRVLWPILVIGLAMIIAPLAMGLPGKASSGQDMIDSFQPIMDPSSVKVTVDYYDNVFTPLKQVVPAVSADNVARFQAYLTGIKAMEQETPQLVPALAQALHMTPAQVQQFLGTQFPATSQMLAGLPRLDADFSQLLGVMAANTATFAKVPGGLDHYQPLIKTMSGNVANYQQIASLPNFRLFTWFFVVPGILLVLLSGWGLLAGRRQRRAVLATT